MRYCSTRGGVTSQTFEEALFTGYCSDGGILVPEHVPTVSRGDLKLWQKLSFPDLAKKILRLFIDEVEIPTADLETILDEAFSTFSCPEIAPLRRCKEGLTVMELFHGRTWAFKDLALSCVGRLYNYFCSKRKTHYTIIVGTSGDTGSAAIEAVRGLTWVDMVVLLPRGRCTQVQELQMTTVVEDNIHVFRADGTSDDIDLVIKPVFMDTPFREQHKLSSINSINWARIMAQTVHYFYAYLQMCPGCDDIVEIAIPTGACGNVTSACFAHKMGLPIRLVCAVNCNDIVSRALSRGDFSVSPTVTPTLAPAMDIQIPYNMERLWYIYSDGDTSMIKELMDIFEKEGSLQVPEALSKKIREVIVDTFVATDDDVKQYMRKVWEDNSYYVCPHTAIAVAYHFSKSQEITANRVCISTASVAKFSEAVKAAGLTVQADDRVKALETMETKYVDLEKNEDWELVLRQKIIEISKKAEQMQ